MTDLDSEIEPWFCDKCGKQLEDNSGAIVSTYGNFCAECHENYHSSTQPEIEKE